MKQFYLSKAGSIFLNIALQFAKAEKQDQSIKLNEQSYIKQLSKLRSYLEKCDPETDTHRYMALKNALDALTAIDQEQHTLGAEIIFKAHVEAINGGETNIYLGGRRIGRKPSVNQAYLRAATVALWKKFKDRRTQLASDARAPIGIGSKEKIRKLVDHFEERHDTEIHKSRSPLSVHMEIVNKLIEDYGYRNLKDFC